MVSECDPPMLSPYPQVMLRIQQEEWFADVPKACGWTSGTITLQEEEGCEEAWKDCIVLSGRVLQVTPTAVVVSCGGLLARAPNDLNLSTGLERTCKMVRILVRRRN